MPLYKWDRNWTEPTFSEFWGCYWGQWKKKWTITDQSILSNDPWSLCKSQLARVTLFFYLSGEWEKASAGECDFSWTGFGFERSLNFLNTLKIAYPCCFFHNIVPSLVWKWHVLLNQSLHDNWILNLKNGNKCRVLYFLSVNKPKWQAPSNIPCQLWSLQARRYAT